MNDTVQVLKGMKFVDGKCLFPEMLNGKYVYTKDANNALTEAVRCVEECNNVSAEQLGIESYQRKIAVIRAENEKLKKQLENLPSEGKP